ncbi:transglutaminase-like putative cysteine protease [Novosphingobium chloroacetimidivorans]|uniref:Transglutaminase-like putative cysteine protease n=1 Tax=Novosphingobium chloroacetimidivorans TaxID=1428314 RepID=A0A7W7NUI5_9SPHN|nr:transglutaminase family protein [Novosphingobium chloroacetimidivorans]MBB4857543.1 transglutaminase-like putative cysteine protease [Novosphingobium chloroacetimidivorans]
MKLSISSELEYDVPFEADLLLQIEAAIIPEQRVITAHIELPPVQHFARITGHDTIGDRIWLRMQGPLKVRYNATVEINRLTADIAQLNAVPPHLLPGETIEYILPSRYCASDQFQQIVGDLFGDTQGGARVAAIRDWIQANLTYQAGSSNAATGAMDTYNSREGVCRDFAHLMISMTRASAIPARFCSVYGLGVEPQDFHAVAEVFLDNTWYMVDATGMSTPDTMAKVGVGRDAADVSFLTSYGVANMQNQSVQVSYVE